MDLTPHRVEARAGLVEPGKKVEEDDAGASLCIPRALQREPLINQIVIASTEDVVHEGEHDADDDHEASEKDLVSELASNARSSAKKPAKNEAGLQAFSMIKHASRAR